MYETTCLYSSWFGQGMRHIQTNTQRGIPANIRNLVTPASTGFEKKGTVFWNYGYRPNNIREPS